MKGERHIYSVLFYEDSKGHSELYEQLINLSKKAESDKDSRIQLKQITLHIELLVNQGTRLPNNITKHISGDIWELLPGKNRILYFYFKDNKFILLHMFRKTTNKTPVAEIERAIKEVEDFKKRNEDKKQ